MVMPGTLSGMKALIQKSTTTSSPSSPVGAGSGVGSSPPPLLSPTQHCTSFGPGHCPVMKVPEQVDPGLFRHVPACPLSLVHDLLMQHLTPAGSSGQAPVTVKAGNQNFLLDQYISEMKMWWPLFFIPKKKKKKDKEKKRA